MDATQPVRRGHGPFPENQLWSQSRVVFAAVHAVGSDNGYAPWTGNSRATPAQRAEVDARIAAAVAWINRAFDLAAAQKPAGIALIMQADTFEGSDETLDGFDEIVAVIGSRAAQPVLLLQGDTRRYLADQPYPAAPKSDPGRGRRRDGVRMAAGLGRPALARSLQLEAGAHPHALT